jgi:hypothetical protein
MDLQTDREILISLDGKLDNVLINLGSVKTYAEGLENRIMAIEICNAGQIEKTKALTSDVEKLKNNNTVWSTLNSIAIIIAALIGIKF